MRTALTIAGSDPTGGAGIQADLKTYSAHGVYGSTVITALTVQNSHGVTEVAPVEPRLVAAQADAVLSDIGAGATKVGMLATRGIVEAVAEVIQRHRLTNVVLDPVIGATSGARLLEAAAVPWLVRLLLPLVTVVTPNLVEAEVLTGRPVRSVADARRAATDLIGLGARAVVVTGGHLDGPAIDVFFDGRTFTEIGAERLATRHTHGTGCTFSAAIAARLALGDDLIAAVRAAKAYVTRAIERAPGLGAGRGPLQHFPG